MGGGESQSAPCRLTEVRTGLSEVEGRLANVGRDSEKQDTQLRER